MCISCLYNKIGNYFDKNLEVFPSQKIIRIKLDDDFGKFCDILLNSFLKHCIDENENLNDLCDISDCCIPDFYTNYKFKKRKHFNKLLESLGDHDYYHYSLYNEKYKYKKNI